MLGATTPNRPVLDRADLVARRRSLGLRQSDLADLAGVSERFVRELESGKASVRLDVVAKVLDVLGLELTLRLRETA